MSKTERRQCSALPTSMLQRRIGSAVFVAAVAVVAVACREEGDSNDTAPRARLQLFANTTGGSKSVVPITVIANWAVPAGSAVGCVALKGFPGAVTFPFVNHCGDAGVQNVTSDAGDGGDATTTQPGLGANGVATACLDFSSSQDANDPDIKNAHTASILAAYTPCGSETAVTVFAALYDDPNCQGTQIATTDIVATFTSAKDGAAADATSEAFSSSDASDSSVDAPPGDASTNDAAVSDGSSDAAIVDAGDQ